MPRPSNRHQHWRGSGTGCGPRPASGWAAGGLYREGQRPELCRGSSRGRRRVRHQPARVCSRTRCHGAQANAAHPLAAPLAGNIFHVNVIVGDEVEAGDVIVVLEAMKMETEVRAQRSGTVVEVLVKAGDKVAVGDPLISVA